MFGELKAIYYGRVELVPGCICDSYVLDDDTAVMTQQGTARVGWVVARLFLH
jgi:hypothetical protein